MREEAEGLRLPEPSAERQVARSGGNVAEKEEQVVDRSGMANGEERRYRRRGSGNGDVGRVDHLVPRLLQQHLIGLHTYDHVGPAGVRRFECGHHDALTGAKLDHQPDGGNPAVHYAQRDER